MRNSVQLRRKLVTAVLLLAALIAIAYLGPRLVRTLTPDRLAAVDDLLAAIWWPATGLRLAVYALLAWGVYPAWVAGHARAPAARRAALPPAGLDPAADAERARLTARLAHLARAGRRQRPVFVLFLASELLLAQFPYWLLRG